MHRTYAPTTERLAGIRGRIELTPTLTGDLLRRGQTVCTYDELTFDSLINRILKAAAERILGLPGLRADVASKMRECTAMLHQVQSVPLSVPLCRQAQLHQNTREYRLPLSVAELLAANLLVDERAGTARFRDFAREDGPLALVFQSFVLNFLSREQSAFRVHRRALRWRDLAGAPSALALMPTMYTDVSLERSGHRVVIETKYYTDPFIVRHGARRLRSAHLYQLYAYLQNTGRDDELVDGVLLYAQVGTAEDSEVVIQGHRVRVATLDLAAEWEEIHRQLVELSVWAASLQGVH